MRRIDSKALKETEAYIRTGKTIDMSEENRSCSNCKNSSMCKIYHEAVGLERSITGTITGKPDERTEQIFEAIASMCRLWEM